MPLQAVIYCRQASANDEGIQRQEYICRTYAGEHGLEIAEVFRDNGFSGSTADRPGLKALLSFLQQAEPGMVVLVERHDRLARDLQVLRDLFDEFGKTGSRYIECDENLGGTSAPPKLSANEIFSSLLSNADD